MQNHLKECNFTSVPDASNKIWQTRLILLVDGDTSRAGCDWDSLGNEKSFQSKRHINFAYAWISCQNVRSNTLVFLFLSFTDFLTVEADILQNFKNCNKQTKHKLEKKTTKFSGFRFTVDQKVLFWYIVVSIVTPRSQGIARRMRQITWLKKKNV